MPFPAARWTFVIKPFVLATHNHARHIEVVRQYIEGLPAMIMVAAVGVAAYIGAVVNPSDPTGQTAVVSYAIPI